MMLCLFLLLLGAPQRTFVLADRVSVDLDRDWTERREAQPPPHEILLPSAPRMSFTDILVLENRREPAVVKLGISDNPFFGITSQALDEQMHAPPGRSYNLVDVLFYLFFSPPPACLVQAKGAWQDAKRKHEAAEEELKKLDATKNFTPSPPPEISQMCRFAPAPLDFFAKQISSQVIFRNPQRVDGVLREFYQPSMEMAEFDGKTFYIFELQCRRFVDREDLDQFGLAEDLRGARAHFFWAVGAPSPFPFVRDPLRKDRHQLYHVAAAMLSVNGDAAARFRKLLESIRVAP